MAAKKFPSQPDVVTTWELGWATVIVGIICGAILLAAAIMANHP